MRTLTPLHCVQKEDSLETQEICTQYNALKLARSLFRCVGTSLTG